MDILMMILIWIVGWLVWYFIFYRRFENKELVNELRKNNLELKHILHASDRDRLEYEQQNVILRDEIEQLYIKNDDLNHIVSELSRYYYHMKKVSHKMQELSWYLQQPLEDLDRKIKPYMYDEDDERNQEVTYNFRDEKQIWSWWFF